MKKLLLRYGFAGALIMAVLPGHAQQTPATTPSVEPTPAKGIEVKALAKPQNSNSLRWQKIIVGQETIDGAEIIGVSKSSVWRRLGFQSGDVIIRVDDHELHSPDDFRRAIGGIDMQNSKIEIKILRQNHEVLLNFQLSW